MKEAALKEGQELPRYNDAMEWLEQVAKGRAYDPAAIQLTFSLVAIHTTSDMTTQAIYDLCGREELVQKLREEIVSVISAEGWKKTALYKLQLMDSFLKESQRLKPINIGELILAHQDPQSLTRYSHDASRSRGYNQIQRRHQNPKGHVASRRQ